MFSCRLSALSGLKHFPLRQVVPRLSVFRSLRGASLNKDKDSVVKVNAADNKSLCVNWNDGHARFHYLWLRHHCPCSECLHPKTKQRTVDMIMIPEQIRPQELNSTANAISIVWNDGHKTHFHASWLKENAYDGMFSEKKSQERSLGAIAYECEMKLWSRDIIGSYPPPEFHYADVINADKILLEEALNHLFRYGFVFINETPTDEESLLKICQKIVGPIMETPEGRVYAVESAKELMSSDLSHFSDALDCHTDFSFYKDPPGIQAMHCLYHNGEGGMSVLVDGFHAAKILLQEDPEAYQILTRTGARFSSTYHCLDAHGAIFELDPFTKELTTIRFNNSRLSDISNMKLNFDEMEKFYCAVRSYGSIVRRPENELWFKLTPGKVVLIDNHRMLHGRSAVRGPRKLIGCYISMADYLGKWRLNRLKSTP